MFSIICKNQHEVLEEKLAIRKNGYIETFVVNETDQDVWFDNMRVMSVSSVIVQETHYDPWGLELTGLGYQYGGIKANKYLYNGKELIEDNGLQYYDYGARMYDPTIGRWGVVDPLSMEYHDVSPYLYSMNNPIRFIDPDGNRVWDMTTDKAHKSALAQFAKTREGREFLAQYAKAGDDIGGVKFANDGKYSHQDVAFYSADYGSKTHGLTRSYLKTKRGNRLDLKHVTAGTVKENLGNLDNLSFAVDISKGISENDALLTIGHEAFIHVEKTTQDVEKGISDLKDGKFGSTSSLFGDFAKFMSGLTGDKSDHKLAVDGNVANMEQFVKALDELYGGNAFTQKHNVWKEHQKKNEENK